MCDAEFGQRFCQSIIQNSLISIGYKMWGLNHDILYRIIGNWLIHIFGVLGRTAHKSFDYNLVILAQRWVTYGCVSATNCGNSEPVDVENNSCCFCPIWHNKLLTKATLTDSYKSIFSEIFQNDTRLLSENCYVSRFGDGNFHFDWTFGRKKKKKKKIQKFSDRRYKLL